MNTEGLREYQKPHAEQLLAALRRNRSALDASDTGTGKTFVACALAREMGITPFVVCPKTVIPSWHEAAQATGIEVETVGYERARGRSGKCAGKECASSGYGAEVPSGSGSRWLWKEPVELAIFDEVHRCGGMTTLSSKMLIAARRQSRFVLMLSATAASRPQKLKAIGFTLGLFEIKDFKWWTLRHGCHPGIFGGFDFTDDPDQQIAAMQKINRELFPARGARLRKRDIPGFPRTQIQVRIIEDASGKAGRLTEELREAYLARREQEKKAKHQLTRLTRARQALELLKVSELAELAEDYAQTSRVAVFVNFSETIDALQKALGQSLGRDQVGAFDGRNLDQRQSLVDDFQNNRLAVLILNSQAGGVGISLHDPTGAEERTALISPCYSVETVKQILGRVHRDGGAFSQQIFVYFSKTREAQIAARLSQKLKNLDALNDDELNGIL